MIALAVWVILFVALGAAAHLFGVDTRDVQYSARIAPSPVASHQVGSRQVASHQVASQKSWAALRRTAAVEGPK